MTAEIAISGIRKKDNAWLAQIEENGVMRPAGAIELIPMDFRKAFQSVSQQLIIGEDHSHIYLDPKIKGRVKFRNWTRCGMLHNPQFVEFVLLKNRMGVKTMSKWIGIAISILLLVSRHQQNAKFARSILRAIKK